MTTMNDQGADTWMAGWLERERVKAKRAFDLRPPSRFEVGQVWLFTFEWLIWAMRGRWTVRSLDDGLVGGMAILEKEGVRHRFPFSVTVTKGAKLVDVDQ